METSVACVLSLVTCQCHMHRGRVVSTSDSESVGRGSIPGGRKSNFFPFVFLLEVIKFLGFFFHHFKVE